MSENVCTGGVYIAQETAQGHPSSLGSYRLFLLLVFIFHTAIPRVIWRVARVLAKLGLSLGPLFISSTEKRLVL